MKNKNLLVLIVILIVAAILRFYHVSQLSFAGDEYALLFSKSFTSFSDFLRQGFYSSNHPAAMQLFTYLTISLFGKTSWIIKLPFILAGLASVIMVYLIGKQWFNATVGLIASAFIATLQLPVMFSQMAVPNGFGLLFTLCVVYFWTRLIKPNEDTFRRDLILFTVFLLLNAYTIYTGFLMSLTIALTGYLFVSRTHRIKYTIATAIFLALYIPQIPALFQFLTNARTYEWVVKPSGNLLKSFVIYLFHYHLITLVAAFILAYLGLWKNRFRNFPWKNIFVFAILFGVLFGLIYVDIHYFGGETRYAPLLIALPFFFFMVFGHIKEQKVWVNALVVVILMSINIYSLAGNRKHFETFYQSAGKNIVTDMQSIAGSNNQTLTLLGGNKPVLMQHLNMQHADTNTINWFTTPEKTFNWLSANASKAQYLYLGELSDIHPLSVPMVQQFFPHLVWQHNYAGGTSYLFSKEQKAAHKIITRLDLTKQNDNWQAIDKQKIDAKVTWEGRKTYFMDAQTDYSPLYQRYLKDILKTPANFIDIEAVVKPEREAQWMEIVTTLEFNDSTIYYSSTPFSTFLGSDSLNQWINVHHSLKLPDITLNHNNIVFKCYIWKRKPVQLYISQFNIYQRQGNPELYGLMEKIYE